MSITSAAMQNRYTGLHDVERKRRISPNRIDFGGILDMKVFVRRDTVGDLIVRTQ